MLTSETVWVALVGIVFLIAIPTIILFLRAGNRQDHRRPLIHEDSLNRREVESMGEFPLGSVGLGPEERERRDEDTRKSA